LLTLVIFCSGFLHCHVVRSGVGCYALFGDAIRARTLQLENKVRKKVSFLLAENDVLKALVSAPWKILAEATSIDDATRLLQPMAPTLEAIPKAAVVGACLADGSRPSPDQQREETVRF